MERRVCARLIYELGENWLGHVSRARFFYVFATVFISLVLRGERSLRGNLYRIYMDKNDAGKFEADTLLYPAARCFGQREILLLGEIEAAAT